MCVKNEMNMWKHFKITEERAREELSYWKKFVFVEIALSSCAERSIFKFYLISR